MRLPGWEKRLFEFIEEASNRTFEYGKHDCALFVCDVIEALTGKNPREIVASVCVAATGRGKYHGEEEAEEVLSKHGGIEAIAVIVAEKFDFHPIPVPFARRGDIVLASIHRTRSLGVCVGDKVAFPAPEGLARVDIDSKMLIRAWRI